MSASPDTRTELDYGIWCAELQRVGGLQSSRGDQSYVFGRVLFDLIETGLYKLGGNSCSMLLDEFQQDYYQIAKARGIDPHSWKGSLLNFGRSVFKVEQVWLYGLCRRYKINEKNLDPAQAAKRRKIFVATIRNHQKQAEKSLR